MAYNSSLRSVLSGGGGGASDWDDIINKPFEFLSPNDFSVDSESGELSLSEVILQQITYPSNLYDDLDNVTANGASMLLFKSDGSSSINWGNRILYDSSSTRSANWTLRVLYDNTDVASLNWRLKILSDNSKSLDWTLRILYDYIGLSSINWNARQLLNDISNPVLNWDTQNLFDNAGLLSLNWNNRMLFDGNENLSISWDNRYLFDAPGIASVDWGMRQLLRASDSEPVLTWGNDITLSPGVKLLAKRALDGVAEVLVELGEYGGYEQTEVGSEKRPLCLNHNAVGSDGRVIGKNIIVNYTDADENVQADAVAYLSDLQAILPELPPDNGIKYTLIYQNGLHWQTEE